MKKRTIIALAIAFIPALGACEDTPTEVPIEVVLFFHASNGVTVLCPDAAVGGVGSVDGVGPTPSGVETASRSSWVPRTTPRWPRRARAT